MDFAEHDALLERLATADRELVFLVGSPLTAPADSSSPGVPDVKAMVERIRHVLRDRPRSLDKLDQELLAAKSPYQTAFRFLSHHRGQSAANTVIRNAVLEALLPEARPSRPLDDAAIQTLENDLDGWHYSPGVDALGRLITAHPKRLGQMVVTTNFDPLVELSIRRARGRAYSTRLHGDRSLDGFQAEGCHVVHVHGYWHGADTLHTQDALSLDRPQLRASLGRLLANRTVVVLGYGGWDDIFTRTLRDLVTDAGAYPDVLWCFYGQDKHAVERENQTLFQQLQPAIQRGRATFYVGIDCHVLLPALLKELAPAAPVAPVAARGTGPARDEAAFVGRQAERDLLLRALERRSPVQLLGPQRMGKSSLLRWVERTAPPLGWAVAFINARGLAGRSPAELVLAAGEAVGRRAEVKEVLYAESAVPDTRAAERALEKLAPLCLLVDEADALSEEDHGFDRGFFEQLRALGQAGKLVWISASERDLFELFKRTGLTSAFLNDARKLRIGRLSQEETGLLLRERGVSDEHVDFAWELGGGVPSALGWLAERLGRKPVELAAVERELRRWLEPLCALWWKRLDSAERARLKRCVGEGLEVAGLEDAERRGARALAEDGFLSEEGGRFRLRGRAWHDFVRDAR